MEKNVLQKVQESRESAFSTNSGYELAMKIAQTLAKSALVPDTYRNKVENCIIALDIARQVNNSPLVVMQNLNIIKGKPSWSSTYIAATIRSRYRNVRVISEGEGKNRSCQVTAYDNDGKIIAEGAKVTMAMAEAEGWTTKEGSKWKTMPDLMLQYRANAFFGRVFCPDALIGLQSEYEVEDISKPSGIILENPFVEAPQKESIDVQSEVVKEEQQQADNIEEMQSSDHFEPLVCNKCKCTITQKISDYSREHFREPLCFKCQKGDKK